MAWCTLWWDGVTIKYSKIPILSINRVWYQNCKNRWIGAIITKIFAGIPNKAAGIHKKVKNLIVSEIDCLKAQDKLNSENVWAKHKDFLDKCEFTGFNLSRVLESNWD